MCATLSVQQSLEIRIHHLLIILSLLALEDLLIRYAGVLSPLVRDERGAMFIFREKSYAALLIGFIISYLPTFSGKVARDLLVLAAIFYFLESGLGWLIYVIYIYHRLQINLVYMPRVSVVAFVSIAAIYIGIALVGSETFVVLVSASDLLRVLINLESLYAENLGSLFLHDAIYMSREYLDISRGHFGDWLNLTPQAPFFILSYFFGIYGVIPACLFFTMYLHAIPDKKNRSVAYIHAMIFINIFVQGFLLSPYLLGYLFITMPRGKINDFNRH